jgi:hypothetical protein|tara:strand:+ start:492 stop:1163 length:672 start_codon:yes stop_codon:yes gene_type:complete
MIDFWVGYTPGREIANKKCRQSLSQFGVVTHDVPHYWVPKTNNPFARTRYLVPLIDYKSEHKWVAFVDDDFLFFKNPLSLYDKLDDSKMLYVAKHPEYVSVTTMKMAGKEKQKGWRNINYPRKNWSSLMIFNKEKFPLTTKEIFHSPMSFLHQLEWAEPEENNIGSIPLEWNWLVGEEHCPDREDINAAHYTLGGPWYEKWPKSVYDKSWIEMKEYDNNKDWS